MTAAYPPITAWAVVYPQGLRAYQGGRHALFLEHAAAAQRAGGTRGAELRTLSEVSQSAIDNAVALERATLLRKFDAYVPGDQASSLRWRIRELEEQVATLRARLCCADSEGGAND